MIWGSLPLGFKGEEEGRGLEGEGEALLLCKLQKDTAGYLAGGVTPPTEMQPGYQEERALRELSMGEGKRDSPANCRVGRRFRPAKQLGYRCNLESGCLLIWGQQRLILLILVLALASSCLLFSIS